uniref:Sushi domain-containing protein n=1 Tax=Salarias fasciatus TaxID=181472 RepID=A0A672IQP1_SALFA
MEGEPFKTCVNGEWSGDMKCLKPCTVNKNSLNNHNIRFKYTYMNKLYAEHNDEMEFACKSGSPVAGSHMRVRCLDGEILCSKVPDIPHGHVSEGTKKSEYQEGDVIHFSCDAGYIADLTSKYVCTSEGWLVIRRGTCYSCATLPEVPHAHVAEETRRDEYREGDMVHFTCDLGHWPELIIKYVCTSEGWLAVRRGSCSGQFASFLRLIHCCVHSVFNFRVLKLGEWEEKNTTCIQTCKILDVPNNVNRDPAFGNDLLKGRNLTFTCKFRGHFIQGYAKVQCLDNGQWSHQFPTCGTPVDCGSPPPLENGDTTETLKYAYSHDERVKFRCQNYYVMEGEPFKTCVNGEWRGDMKCLKPCTVNKNSLNNHNIRFKYTYMNKLYAEHNDEMHFACKSGSPVAGNDMRVRCLDGEIRLPTCQ